LINILCSVEFDEIEHNDIYIFVPIPIIKSVEGTSVIIPHSYVQSIFVFSAMNERIKQFKIKAFEQTKMT
jgi:hypothetical protein